MSEIEGELQGARRYYNATVRDLNTQVQSFPDVLFAGPLGFGEEPYYAGRRRQHPDRAEGRIRTPAA